MIPAVASLLTMVFATVIPAASRASIGPCPAERGPDPYLVQLVPTAHANGARGTVRLRFAESPFVVTVTQEGNHRYQADFLATLPGRMDAVPVVWVATPSLDRHEKLGALDAAGTLSAEIHFTKFLVFVTAESSADVVTWSGPILLRGMSPSGRMHTMAGHGPFANENCQRWFGPGGFGAGGGG